MQTQKNPFNIRDVSFETEISSFTDEKKEQSSLGHMRT